MKSKNQPVGTIECDRKACTETCKVFKFRPRAEGRRTVFTDKYYFECPNHGRIGADGNPTVTEYILCNAKMDGAATAALPKNRAPATTPAAGARATSSSTPGSSGATAKSTDSATATQAGWWRTLIDLE
jgi:hypothetical protein